ncbi:HGGxSTG domain-containing protein [Leptospira interrogans]
MTGDRRMDSKRLIALFRATLRDSAAATNTGPSAEPNRAVPHRCGARTRAGHPCQRKGLGRGGRCPNHGGLSSGARTEEGRARISRAQKQRWRKWRAKHQRNTRGVA